MLLVLLEHRYQLLRLRVSAIINIAPTSIETMQRIILVRGHAERARFTNSSQVQRLERREGQGKLELNLIFVGDFFLVGNGTSACFSNFIVKL